MGGLADVSIIVPTYDRAEYLGDALQSLVTQTLPAREIIVIDDGSSDDTRAVVARFGNSVTYRYQDNGGKSSALNHALKHAAGAMIWIFDDDDIADPNALRLLSDALAARPEAGFVFGDYDIFEDGPRGRIFRGPRAGPGRPGDIFASTMFEFYVHQPAMLTYAACYRAIGDFAEHLPRAVDLDMLLRLGAVYPGTHVPGIVFHQRQHDGVRGPARYRVRPEDRWRAWHIFGQAIVREQCERHDERIFLPFHRRADPGLAARVDGLLRRSAVLAWYGIDDLAARDLASLARYGERLDRSEIGSLDWDFFTRMLLPGYATSVRGPVLALAAMRSCRDRRFGRAARAALRRALVRIAGRALWKRRPRAFLRAVGRWCSLAG